MMTPASTIDALMFELRQRGKCSEERLQRCDPAAITEIAGRLTALGWPDDRIVPVISAWRATVGC